MDWQTPVAAAIAVLCGVWLVWQLARPFATGEPMACGGCTFCGADGRRRGARRDLVQLQTLDGS